MSNDIFNVLSAFEINRYFWPFFFWLKINTFWCIPTIGFFHLHLYKIPFCMFWALFLFGQANVGKKITVASDTVKSLAKLCFTLLGRLNQTAQIERSYSMCESYTVCFKYSLITLHLYVSDVLEHR